MQQLKISFSSTSNQLKSTFILKRISKGGGGASPPRPLQNNILPLPSKSTNWASGHCDIYEIQTDNQIKYILDYGHERGVDENGT